MFRKSEIAPLAVSILVMGLALGFDDGRAVFALLPWMSNLLSVSLVVAISFLLHQFAHKVLARMNGFDTEYSLWGVQRFSLSPYVLFGKSLKAKPFPRKIKLFGKERVINVFPLGLVLSLLIMVLSQGKLFFLAVGDYTLLLKKASRFGRKFVEVTHYDEAKIALVGPLVHIVLLVFAKLFNTHGTFDMFMLANASMALFYMLPLPGLDGSKIYFGSRLLYVSSLIFMVSMVILAYTVSFIPMLLISLLSALLAFVLYYYFRYTR